MLWSDNIRTEESIIINTALRAEAQSAYIKKSNYRVPRLLIKDERFKELSIAAKLLYGLMLDKMSLSVKNGWFDDENRHISFIP